MHPSDILKKLHEEWVVIKQYRYSFLSVCLLSACALWAIFHYIYSDRLADAGTDIAHWKNEADYWKGLATRKDPVLLSPPAPVASTKSKPIAKSPTPIPKPAPTQACPNGICIGGENSGTATVNNFGIQEPRIAPADSRTLTQYLAGFKSDKKIRIGVYQSFNNEKFAADLYQVFKDAGWKMQDEYAISAIGFCGGGICKGVQVVVKGEPSDETVNVDRSDPLYYIGQTLTALKLDNVLRKDPNQPDDLITIQILGSLSK